jgi:hypothetical protein
MFKLAFFFPCVDSPVRQLIVIVVVVSFSMVVQLAALLSSLTGAHLAALLRE